MYHGTLKSLKVIEPVYSRLVDSHVVYATTDIHIAACFIPKWSGKEIELGRKNGRNYIVELEKDALEKWHVSGNIYLVDGTHFGRHTKLGMASEFISYVSVVPQKMYPVSDVLEFIRGHFDIYRYSED